MSLQVLIAEDDSSIADMYSFKCNLAGMIARHAPNGMAALSMLEDFTPDVVLLDLMMPEMNGEEFLQQFRSRPQFSSTPVIILTNMGKEEIPKSITPDQVSDIIIKSDCTPSEVIEKIKAVAAV